MSGFTYHQPVLLSETLEYLKVRPEGIYVDATVGGGGHAAAIAGQLGPRGHLIGLDVDPQALQAAGRRLSDVEANVTLQRANFKSLSSILDGMGIEKVDGILMDLGVSSHQLDDVERGFTYRDPEAPLDMRMDPRQALTASDVVNGWSESELSRVIRRFGEEKWADRIAQFIVQRRENSPIRTAGELVEIIKDAIPAAARRGGPHPARRTFQALRIAVNRELEALEASLSEAVHLVRGGGRMVVISFHSLEDRVVKSTFRHWCRECRCPPDLPVCRCGGPIARDLTRRPVRPSEEEIKNNPRSRSSRLRAIEILPNRPGR